MKKSLVVAAILLLNLCMFTLSSCDKDEKNDLGKPVIVLSEVGPGNNKTGIVGSDLHLEGDITAENLIERIDIEIHQEGGGSYRIVKSFTEGKYIGVKNAHFHEHIDIPADAPVGNYHLHFTVTDQKKQTETKESELKVEAASTHITVEGLKFGASHTYPDNKLGYAGTRPLIAAHIKAENGIDKIMVSIHNETGTPEFKLDTTYIFAGEKEWGAGTEHIHVILPENAPVGDYHIHFDVYDKNGEVSRHVIEGVQFKKSNLTMSTIEIGNEGVATALNIHAKFNVMAEEYLVAITVRIYKETKTKDESGNEVVAKDKFYDRTMVMDPMKSIKTYGFDSTLEAKDAGGNPASAGDYIFEITVEYAFGAKKTFKENLKLQ